MRLNNLELRKLIGNNKKFEIICWFPNSYYGKIDEYQKTGDSMYYRPENPNSFVHEDCFKNKEFCYVVSFIDNGIPEFIANNPMELNGEQEYKDFLWLLRKGISKSLRYKIK